MPGNCARQPRQLGDPALNYEFRRPVNVSARFDNCLLSAADAGGRRRPAAA